MNPLIVAAFEHISLYERLYFLGNSNLYYHNSIFSICGLLPQEESDVGSVALKCSLLPYLTFFISGVQCKLLLL